MSDNLCQQITLDWREFDSNENDIILCSLKVISNSEITLRFRAEIVIPKKRVGVYRIMVIGKNEKLDKLCRLKKFDLKGSHSVTKDTIVIRNAMASKSAPYRLGQKEHGRVLLSADEISIESKHNLDLTEDSYGYAYLSESIIFEELSFKTFNYDGTIVKDKTKNVKIKIDDNIDFLFVCHTTFIKHEEGTTIHPNNVVEFKGIKNESDFNRCIELLKDIICLGAFADNQLIQQLGYTFIGKNRRKDVYHLNKLFPKGKPKQYLSNVQRHYADDFLNTSFKALIESPFRESIKRVILGIVNPPSVLEYRFITEFASLECILDCYKKINNLNQIVNNDWSKFVKGIHGAIKNTPVETTKEQRKQMNNKICELNRFPFSTVFNNFIEERSLNVDDLWPVVSESNKNNLLNIRNKLVHGYILKDDCFDILSIAAQNLEWLLKRIILSFLKWDIEKSQITLKSIGKLKAYTEWKSEVKRGTLFE